MLSGVFPFVYALAARELGRVEMQKMVGFEPVGDGDSSNLPTGMPRFARWLMSRCYSVIIAEKIMINL